MQSQEHYKKKYGLMWRHIYNLDKVAEQSKKEALKQAQENKKKIAKRAKEQDALDKKFKR